MGSFTFKWSHPAEEVFVTGTFDDWSKSVQLEKKDGIFEKTVELSDASQKIFYKFVVDGNWVTDHTAAQEADGNGYVNNVLNPSDITLSGIAGVAAIANSHVTDAAAAIANKGPSSDIPGGFPETPADEIKEPTSQAAEPTFGVSPLPATEGAGNPIKLQPGEPVPPSGDFTTNTVDSKVTLDKESYEKAGSANITGAPQIAPVLTPAEERAKQGHSVFDVPEISNSKNIIPESSLPMGDSTIAEEDPGVTIQSAAPTSTTAALAGAVPLEPRQPEPSITTQSAAPTSTTAALAGAVPIEPRQEATQVPEVVKESQNEAHFAPEASAVPAVVAEKAALEQELLKEVPTEPPTAQGISTGEVAEPTGLSSEVPVQVEESVAEANESPEALANPIAVEEKREVEQELLSEIPKSNEAGEPAPTTSAALATSAPSATTTTTDGLAASASSQAATPATKLAETKPAEPATAPTTSQTTPTVTSGVSQAATSSTNGSTTTDKKAKSRSFFGKLKDKLTDKK